MTTEENRGRAGRGCCYFVVLADQLSGIYTSGISWSSTIPVLPVLDITRMHNARCLQASAVASGWQRWVFISLAVVVEHRHHGILRLPRGAHRALAVGLARPACGFGNLIDRIRWGMGSTHPLSLGPQCIFPCAEYRINVADHDHRRAAFLLDALLEAKRKK